MSRKIFFILLTLIFLAIPISPALAAENHPTDPPTPGKNQDLWCFFLRLVGVDKILYPHEGKPEEWNLSDDGQWREWWSGKTATCPPKFPGDFIIVNHKVYDDVTVLTISPPIPKKDPIVAFAKIHGIEFDAVDYWWGIEDLVGMWLINHPNTPIPYNLLTSLPNNAIIDDPEGLILDIILKQGGLEVVPKNPEQLQSQYCSAGGWVPTWVPRENIHFVNISPVEALTLFKEVDDWNRDVHYPLNITNLPDRVICTSPTPNYQWTGGKWGEGDYFTLPISEVQVWVFEIKH